MNRISVCLSSVSCFKTTCHVRINLFIYLPVYFFPNLTDFTKRRKSLQ